MWCMVVMIEEHDSINCYYSFRKLFGRSIKVGHMHMFTIYTCIYVHQKEVLALCTQELFIIILNYKVCKGIFTIEVYTYILIYSHQKYAAIINPLKLHLENIDSSHKLNVEKTSPETRVHSILFQLYTFKKK